MRKIIRWQITLTFVEMELTAKSWVIMQPSWQGEIIERLTRLREFVDSPEAQTFWFIGHLVRWNAFCQARIMMCFSYECKDEPNGCSVLHRDGGK